MDISGTVITLFISGLLFGLIILEVNTSKKRRNERRLKKERKKETEKQETNPY